MPLPYAGDHPPGRKPIMTVSLMIIHIALAVWMLIARNGTRIQDIFGIVPAHFNALTLVSYLFFHDGFGHLIINLCYLWVFGAGVEAALGAGRLLFWYILAGVCGGALQSSVSHYFTPEFDSIPLVGASAACAGLVGMYAVRYYRARLHFVGMRFQPHVVTVVSLYLAVEMGLGLINLIGGSTEGGVAHWAHVCGFLTGLIGGQLLHLDIEGSTAYLVEDAADAMRSSDLGGAIRRWQVQLMNHPNDTLAAIELARAWMYLGDREHTTETLNSALTLRLNKNDYAAASEVYQEMNRLKLEMPSVSAGSMVSMAGVLAQTGAVRAAADLYFLAAKKLGTDTEAEVHLVRAMRLYDSKLKDHAATQKCARLILEHFPSSQWRSQATQIVNTEQDSSASIPN